MWTGRFRLRLGLIACRIFEHGRRSVLELDPISIPDELLTVDAWWQIRINVREAERREGRLVPLTLTDGWQVACTLTLALLFLHVYLLPLPPLSLWKFGRGGKSVVVVVGKRNPS